MKTIIDAVNELRGSVSNVFGSSHDSMFICFNNDRGHWTATNGSPNPKFTIAEFNATIKELEGWQSIYSFDHPIERMSYAEYKEWYAVMNGPTLESGNVETVTVDGMVYEIGKSYITTSCELAILASAELNGRFLLKYPDANGSNCTFDSSTLSINPEWTTGTITPAPVDLVDGKAYQFDRNRETWIGFYSFKRGCFVESKDSTSSGGEVSSVEICTNIIPLVPEV